MDALERYYGDYDEDARLVKDNAHRIEFLTSVHYLDRILVPGSAVLDVAAGTGPYAFYLAARGHRVTARDIVPRHVAAMRARAAELKVAVDVGWVDARDLSSFGPAILDAVLCMGPLYHIESEAGRREVVEQCLRVLRPGGVLAAAYINEEAAYLAEVLAGRRALGSERSRRGASEEFSYWHSREVEALMAELGVAPLAHVAADGISYLLAERINALDEKGFARWFAHHLSTCEDPSMIGYGLHCLYIGRKS